MSPADKEVVRAVGEICDALYEERTHLEIDDLVTKAFELGFVAGVRVTVRAAESALKIRRMGLP